MNETVGGGALTHHQGRPEGLRLTRLTLGRYRNYPALSWLPGGQIVVISGANGSGKTNVLESISFLVPGRGLRGARIAEVASGATGAWGAHGWFDTPDGPVEIGTGTTDEAPDRRVFRLDGVAPRNQAELSSRVAAVWLTPQMDRLFQEGLSGRRRFLDRLVYAIEPSHAREVAAHDTAMAGRNRLLAEGRRDPAWLAGLEDAMARHAVAVMAARADLVTQLNTALASGIAGRFPAAQLGLVSPIADLLAHEPALAVEDQVRQALATSRDRDAVAGSATLGAHRCDMALHELATGQPAAQASTGQQKALLIGVILGHASLLAGARGFAPLLLLDEPATHLDPQRREALFEALSELPAQVFLTGTDAATFDPVRGRAAFWQTGKNALHADP